ncbi:hypothetical protein BH18THE2_BH18THE2_27650 [soil metagenome]
MSSTASIQEIEINEDLKKCGVSRFVKEGLSLLVECNEKITIFRIQDGGLLSTLLDFKEKSKGKIDSQTQEKIIFTLSKGEYYPNIILNGKTRSGDIHGDSDYKWQRDTTSSVAIDPSKELDPYIRDRDYAGFVIRTIKKTVKQEDLLVRLLVFVGLTVYSFNPLCIGIRAPTSEGKTYAVIESILNFFPKQDVWLIGSMSPKTLIRQHGILVDNNGCPLDARIKILKKQIMKESGKKGSYDKKIELEEELEKLYSVGKYLIDLHGKILVFLEPPRPELWEIIKPILSHDAWEIEHPYVDADLKTRNVVTRGWPVCIFCSAKDESKWDIWPEIQSRFLIASPNMTQEKYLESNKLTFQRLGLPGFVQNNVIVSPTEVGLARKCILYLKQRIHELCPVNHISNENKPLTPIWIPYQEYLAESLPHNRGSSMRTAAHIGSLLKIVTLARSQYRLDCGIEKSVIARPEDLVEVLQITRNMTRSNYNGVPAHKIEFMKEIFSPIFKSKKEPDKDKKGERQEKIIGVTSSELCTLYKKKRGRGINTDNLKKQYLNEMLANDLIGETVSEIDKRYHIYYPLVEIEEDSTKTQKERITKLSNDDTFDNFSYIPTIELSKKYKDIPDNWLIFQILGIAKHRIDIEHFKGCLADFVNKSEEFKLIEVRNEYDGGSNGSSHEIRLTIKQFITKYESNQATSIRYIFKGQFYNFYSKTFGNMIGICLFQPEKYKILSNETKFDDFVISGSTTSTRNSDEMFKTALQPDGGKKGLYQEYIIQRIEDFFSGDPNLPWQPLPEHTIEESPCYHIIETDEFKSPDTTTGTTYYRCKIHPMIWNFDFEEIEYHCKYQEPGIHKSEILRLLHSNINTEDNFAETGQG